MADITPFDVVTAPPLRSNPWAQAVKDAQDSTQQAMGVSNAAQGPPSVPAAVEQPKLAQLTPTTSQGETTTPLDVIGGAPQAGGIAPSTAKPGQAKPLDVQPLAPKQPSTFQSFLSTLRDVATGRPSQSGSIVGDIRGTAGRLSDVLSKAAIAMGGPQAIAGLRQAEASESLRRAQMAQTGELAKMREQEAERWHDIQAPGKQMITVQEGDQYHQQGIPLGTYRPADIAGLIKTKQTLESKESEGELNRQNQLAMAELKSRYKTTPMGLYDTKTGKTIKDTGAGIPLTAEIAADYDIPPEYIGSPVKVSDLAMKRRSQAMFAPKVTQTERPMIDVEGNLIKVPVTTTMTPQRPQQGPSAVTPTAAPFSPEQGAPGAVPSKAPPVAAPKLTGTKMKAPVTMFATDAEGRQVAGTPTELKQAGITNYSPLPSGEVAKMNIARQLTNKEGLISSIEDDLKKFKPNELNILDSRWQEFKAGKVGAGDSRFTALRTHTALLDTAAMQAHVGATGGTEMMTHFSNLVNAGKMNASTLKAAVGAERGYFEEKAMRPTKKGAEIKGGPAVGSVEGGYRYKGGDPSKQTSWEKVK